jgi:quercetin 2,3-dioxygenase
MIQIRPSQERGGGDHVWLKTHHTFSFSDYWDPKWMGFRSLRVTNEDWVAPNTGFPTHPHRDMEIITYVLEGKPEHKDSARRNPGGWIRAADVEKISRGGTRLAYFHEFLSLWPEFSIHSSAYFNLEDGRTAHLSRNLRV